MSITKKEPNNSRFPVATSVEKNCPYLADPREECFCRGLTVRKIRYALAFCIEEQYPKCIHFRGL